MIPNVNDQDIVGAGERRPVASPPLVNRSHLNSHNSQKRTSWFPILIGCGCLMFSVPVIAVLISLLLPAVQSAREAARRSQCLSNLRQMGLGVHNYEGSYEVFPSWALKDDSSKPLLSWRVQLLPSMGEDSLYKEFHLDEPWDSPHNLTLLPRMPKVYQCPTENLQPGFTNYKVFVGEKTMFPDTGPVRIASITDGTSNTLMVVESSVPVEWTKPDGILVDNRTIDQLKLGSDQLELGSKHPGGFQVLMADGSVRFIKSSMDSDTLKGIITRNGDEVISADSY